MDKPLPPDTNNAPQYLITAGIFSLIAFALCCARISTKARSSRMRLDDYTIAIAETLSLAGYCAAIGASLSGWGHVSFYVPEKDKVVALKCLFAVQVLWIFTICLVRMSVALSLLRLSLNLWWKTSLWALIVIQGLLSSGWLVVQFAWCRPLRSSWEFVPDVQCWDYKHQINYGWVTSAIFVAMDLTFALMPLKLIHRLHRPLRERILVGCLMATGLVATALACVKMSTFTDVGKLDLLSSTHSSLLAKLEELLGIIAACTPCLKAPAERTLRRLGVLSTHARSMSRPSFVDSKTPSAGGGSRRIALWGLSKQANDGHAEASRLESRESSATRNYGMNGSSSARSGWNSILTIPGDDTGAGGGSVTTVESAKNGWEAV